MQADYDAGIANGINGTPTMFINGEMVIGALPIEAFQEVIDRKLR